MNESKEVLTAGEIRKQPGRQVALDVMLEQKRWQSVERKPRMHDADFEGTESNLNFIFAVVWER